MPMVRGSCLCGGVVYEVPAEDIGDITTCYCSLCRKNHGAERRLRARTIAKRFRWVKGENNLSRFAHGVQLEKHFCRVCGTPLINRYGGDSAALGLVIATLDDDPGKRCIRHDHIASKPKWLTVDDDLAQFDTVPDVVGQVISINSDSVIIQSANGVQEQVRLDRDQLHDLSEGDSVRASLAFAAFDYHVRRECKAQTNSP